MRRFGFHRSAVDQPQRATSSGFAAEKNIRSDVQIVEKMKLLMDKPDSVTRRIPDRMNRYDLSIDDDFAGVRPADAAENFHQCRFARAILPDERHHFRGKDIEVYGVKSRDSGKPLRD